MKTTVIFLLIFNDFKILNIVSLCKKIYRVSYGFKEVFNKCKVHILNIYVYGYFYMRILDTFKGFQCFIERNMQNIISVVII